MDTEPVLQNRSNSTSALKLAEALLGLILGNSCIPSMALRILGKLEYAANPRAD